MNCGRTWQNKNFVRAADKLRRSGSSSARKFPADGSVHRLSARRGDGKDVKAVLKEFENVSAR